MVIGEMMMKIDLTASTNALKVESLQHAGLSGHALDLMCAKPLSNNQHAIRIRHKTLRELLIYLGVDVDGRSDAELNIDTSMARNKVLIYLLLDIIGNTSVEFFLDNSDTRMNWANKLNSGTWTRNKDNNYWNSCTQLLFDEIIPTQENVIDIEISKDIITFKWDNIHNGISKFQYSIVISEILNVEHAGNLSWWLNLCKLAIYGISSDDSKCGGELITKVLVNSTSDIINIITYDKYLIDWNNLYNKIFSIMCSK